jgi:hypothetical protein
MIRAIANKLFWGFLHRHLSDRQYARYRFWLSTGRKLNLDQPVTFSDKINWLKLNERTELRKRVADRNEVRSFVKERIGEKYLIPLVGVYDNLTRDIWQALPERFVLKANHGSGMIRIVKSKQDETFEEIKSLTDEWQQTDYALFGREWVYEGLPRKIIAEELVLTGDGSVPRDVKFFCFHGKVGFIQIDFDRFTNQKRNIYDRDFNKLNVSLLHPNFEGEVPKPPGLEKAIGLAEKLSDGFSFIRVDLYLPDEQIYFGELTNFPGNGFEPFIPVHFDEVFGSYLNPGE